MAPGLLRIPTELQHMIAKLTGKKNILTLRLVCRDLCRAIDDPFLEAFYSKRRHLVTKHSLEYLTTISADARLRSKLREVELVVTDLKSWMNPDVPSSRYWAQPYFKQAGVQKEKQEDWERRAVWVKWRTERDELWAGAAMNSLFTMLKNLSAAGIIPALRLSADVTRPLAFGCQQICAAIGIPPPKAYEVRQAWEDFWDDDQEAARATMGILLRVVASASFPVKILNLGNGSAPFSLAPFAVETSVITMLEHSLRRLKTLSWSLVKTEGQRDEEEEQQEMDGLRTVMRSARALEDLDLDFGDQQRFSDAPLDARLGEVFVRNRLKSLKLHGGFFQLDSLKAFLLPHKDTLKTLEMNSVALETVEDWRVLFKQLAGIMQLDRVLLLGLYAGGPSQSGEFFHLSNALVRDGEEETRSGLESFVRGARFLDPDASEDIGDDDSDDDS